MRNHLHCNHQRGSATGAIVGLVIAVVVFGVLARFMGAAQLEKMQALELAVAASPSLPVIMEKIDRGTCGYLVPDVSARIMSVIVCPSCARLAAQLHSKYDVTLQSSSGCTRGPYNTLEFAHKRP